MQASLDSISRQLDDMLSMSFGPYIVICEPPRGFVVPKFTMYDGTSDLFDHIMYFRQLIDVPTMPKTWKEEAHGFHTTNMSHRSVVIPFPKFKSDWEYKT